MSNYISELIEKITLWGPSSPKNEALPFDIEEFDASYAFMCSLEIEDQDVHSELKH